MLSASEKSGGNPLSNSRHNKFCTAVDLCNLMDLGYQGPKFTRSNLRRRNANIKERLDRDFVNSQWR